MQNNTRRETYFKGDMKGTEKNGTIMYIQARPNPEFCLIQELVPDSDKEGAGNLANGSSCVTYRRKPFPRSQEN